MKAKTLLPLLVICGLFAYLGLQKPSRKKVSGALDTPKPFEQMDLNAISSISIKKANEHLTIEQQNDQWRAKNGELDYPIDPSNLLQLLRSIQETQLLDHLANDRQHDHKFGLSKADNPTFVTLKSGEKNVVSLELGAGRKGSAGNSPFGFAPEEGQYLRFGVSEHVYFAKESVDAQTQAEAWMQKNIVETEQESISKVELNYPDKTLVFSKSMTSKTSVEEKDEKEVDAEQESPMVWSAEQGFASGTFQPDRINSLLNALEAIAITTPLPAHNASQLKADETYRLKTFNGEDQLYHLSFQSLGDDWVVWQGDEPQELYSISGQNVEEIFASNHELFDLDPIQLDGDLQKASWSNQDGNMPFENILSKWSLSTDGEHPPANQDLFDDIANALENMDVLDVHPQSLNMTTLSTLTLSTNSQLMVLEDLGQAPFDNARLVRVDGKSMFSISTEHGMTLFPETFWSETEDLSTEEILSISNGAIKAHQKDEVWTSESGERLRDDAIQSWIDAFNGIQASNYLPSKTLSGKVRSLTIQFSNDTKKEAKLGKTEKGFTQVQLAPFTGVYQLDANLAKVLSNGADVFLEKKTEPVETSADLEEN